MAGPRCNLCGNTDPEIPKVLTKPNEYLKTIHCMPGNVNPTTAALALNLYLKVMMNGCLLSEFENELSEMDNVAICAASQIFKCAGSGWKSPLVCLEPFIAVLEEHLPLALKPAKR